MITDIQDHQTGETTTTGKSMCCINIFNPFAIRMAKTAE